MKKAVWSTLIAAQLAVIWFAVAQATTNSPTPTTLAAVSYPREPAIAVSPSSLDFGLVGVGRTKDLTLTVRNLGEVTLEVRAAVPTPFAIAGDTYSLRSGKSRELKVRFRPTAEGTNSETVVLSGSSAVTVPVTGYARTPPPPPGKLRVKRSHVTKEQVDAASFIFRYYSDPVSYMVKPLKVEPGGFPTIYDQDSVLKLAGEQPGRELAIVVLPFYPGSALEVEAKLSWWKGLTALGYQRIIFVDGRSIKPVTRIEGGVILEDPQVPMMPAGR